MKRSPSLIIPFMLGAVIILLIAVYVAGAPGQSPVGDAQQLVLALADTDSSTTAVIAAYSRMDDGWKPEFSSPAVIGRNGMAWGSGLHKPGDHPADRAVKREGDGCSPEGAFPLLEVYGYLPATAVRTAMPYTRSADDLICCDDAESDLYNRIVDTGAGKLDPSNLPSHEMMRRSDDLYKYVIVVGHNMWKPEPGAGSCIFLHLWRGPDSSTAGCTAFSEETMLRILGWLDPAKNPAFVLLTADDYRRFLEPWGLPDIAMPAD